MQLSMIPARLLQPWEVLQIDFQMIHEGEVVDLLPPKDALRVSRKLLELFFRLGLPLSMRSDNHSRAHAVLVCAPCCGDLVQYISLNLCVATRKKHSSHVILVRCQLWEAGLVLTCSP